MHYCKDCTPPCSYGEENPNGICQFKSDATPSDAPVHGVCPEFEDPKYKKDLVIERFLFEDDDQVVYGNCKIAKDALVDFRGLTALQNLIIDSGAEVTCLFLEVFGDVIIGDGAKLIVEDQNGPPLVHGRIICEGTGKLLIE